MERNNQLKNRRIRASGAVLAGALLVGGTAACANYSGEGNGFEVAATVDHSGDQSVTVHVKKVNRDKTHGDASDWFDSGSHQIHDNYHSSFSEHTVGKVYDIAHHEIAPHDIPAEACVIIDGAIRSDTTQAGKSTITKDRPVYDTVQEVPCDTLDQAFQN